MARVLVIGGTLFLGRAIVDRLLQRDDEVVLMHRGKETPYGSRVGEIRCDRNDTAAVRDALSGERFDIVYDNVYDWQRGTTAEQVCAAVNAVSDGLRRYVFMSSIAVYGEGGEYEEDVPLVPSDSPLVYAAQKADTERALFELHRDRNIPVTTLRPAFVHGPYNPFEREAFFWDRILADRPVIIPEDGARTMQWVYSHDVGQAAILAAGHDVANGRAYNLASHPPVTQVEFVQLLAKIAGKSVELVPVPREQIQRAGGELMAPPLYFGVYLDVPPITVRVDRVQADLGFKPAPLEEGLQKTYRWYRQQQRPRPDFAWEDRLLVAAR